LRRSFTRERVPQITGKGHALASARVGEQVGLEERTVRGVEPAAHVGVEQLVLDGRDALEQVVVGEELLFETHPLNGRQPAEQVTCDQLITLVVSVRLQD
jgi:hypothetical protein